MFNSLPVDILRLAAWLAILAIVFVPLERLFALHDAKVLRKDIAADVGFYFLNSLVPTLILGLPFFYAAYYANQYMPHGILAAVSALPVWAKVVASLVVGEIGAYWGHRWSHQIPFLWQFHEVHHTPEHMDFLVNTRAHPVDMVFTHFCSFIPLYVIGLVGGGNGAASDATVLIVVKLVLTAWGFFIHANVRWRLGPLEWILATPAFHHWHHVQSGPINRNYAAMLPVLDRLFGTHHLPPKQWPARYGVDNSQT